MRSLHNGFRNSAISRRKYHGLLVLESTRCLLPAHSRQPPEGSNTFASSQSSSILRPLVTLPEPHARVTYKSRSFSLKIFHQNVCVLFTLTGDRTLFLFGLTGQEPGRKATVQSHVPFADVEPTTNRSLFSRCTSLLRPIVELLSIMPSHLRSSHRAYSFPPWIEMAEHEAPHTSALPDIDEDPFAHFISPITEADDPYELSLSAGIVHDGPRTSKASKFKSNVANKWARYVQHNHSNLHGHYHTATIQEEEEDEEETFMGLDDDRLNDTPQIVSQLSPPRIAISESSRGRPQDLVARKTQNRRRYSRTLSGHRHSWRAPSPDLFTVDESEEEESPVLRRTRTRKPKDGTDRRRSSTRSRSRVRFDVTEKSRL
ncbi:hypothetical protein T440DRAFT_472086 [Plenodomus tracheiphilus IPT5]|uniref:Uncharacterized protein n=1 Tax=Plenodomus tracheiphilus IPT5 TaxID=1408161 RepID=A0A6A7ARZ7_9PLEO|nr:hypothetical protein T440DRAFT_472086 [Plenodomus tracheiphilus IPT5]